MEVVDSEKKIFFLNYIPLDIACKGNKGYREYQL